MNVDCLITNCRLVSFANDRDGYGLIPDGTVAIMRGEVVYAGPSETCDYHQAERHIDADSKCLTPGLVDCHTHLVFAGNRAQEFESRLRGQSYESIAKRGGGIAASVTATRAASKEELYQQSAKRLERLLEEGVTTVEIKSGYGLNLATEIKMLEVARKLGEHYPVTVTTTLLAAHALAPEFQRGHAERDKQAYIDFVCDTILPAAAERELVDAVDVFCEHIGFSHRQCEQVFLAARALNLPIKGHVEQLSDLKGAVLAARYGALSVDHIEYLADADVPALNNSVAVLLPAAFYCLNETRKPPIEALRKHQVPMAVATDLNPGTAPMASLLTAMHQACISFGLTPQESLKGATCNAARALGFEKKGRIEPGCDADLLLWDIQHPAELAYGVNFNRPSLIWRNGHIVGGTDFEQ